MKTPRHSITFFSFFPVVALLGAPLLFSTLAPASSQNFATEIDSSDWDVPQSQLVLEEFLKEQEVKNGEIEEVKFLDYGDSIYGGGENASSLISSSPAILDSGEIDTAYVLQNPEFQRQVEEVSAQAEKAGAAMPPLLTLVALFAFAVATGTSSLKDFFKFSTYTDKVKKTIQVTKKVAKTVYRTITETVARKVKTIKQVAYTAYETVKNVTYNTRTWFTEVVRPVPQHHVDRLKKTVHFIRKIFAQHSTSLATDSYFRKNERYILQGLVSDRDLDSLKKDFDDVMSGRKVGRFAQNVHKTYNRENYELGNLMYGMLKILEGADPKAYAKVKNEYDKLIAPTYIEKTTHSETTPIVTFTQKPYTAYRDEVETKIVYDTVTREVPETIYEDVTEDREITEDVTRYSFTPMNEKIDLAMGYLKNYSRILQNPSNRNFSDSALLPNRDLSMFAGAMTVYNNLQAELKTANVYNMDRTDPEDVKKILKRHNEFVYSMKGILTKIQKGQTPEEQMTLLFGKDYTDSIIGTENAIAEISADEKALTARFNEIEELLRTNKISTGYYRSLYNSAKRNRDQLYRRQRDAEKDLKKSKEYYASKFNGTISSLQNLSFLRSLEDWRRTLDYGQRSAASRLVPFTTANGSVIYRKPAQTTTTTAAQPKKTIPQPAPANLIVASNSRLNTLLDIVNAKAQTVVNSQSAVSISSGMLQVKVDGLNVRKDAGKEYANVTAFGGEPLKLFKGEQVFVIGQNKEKTWLNIRTASGIEGYVSNDKAFIGTYTPKSVSAIKSTNPDPETNKKETLILRYLANNTIFPLREPSISAWGLNLASWFHDGNGFYSADLNLTGSADHGRPVYSPGLATVVKNATGTDTTNTLTLKHFLLDPDTGKPVTFYTQYLHMEGIGKRNADGKITPFKESDIVRKDDIIGLVSDQGSKGSYHMHFEVNLDGKFGKSIDLRPLLVDHFGVAVTAEDAGADGLQRLHDDNKSLPVDWDEDLGAFVTVGNASSNPHLVLDRSDQLLKDANGKVIDTPTDKSNQHWLAWEDGKSVGEMQRVVNQKIGIDKVTKKEVYAWTYTNSNGAVSVWNNDISATFQFTDLEKYKLTLKVE